MPKTDRFQIELPVEFQSTWYELRKAADERFDQILYDLLESQNVMLRMAGVFSLTLGTDSFAWSSAIELISPITGKIATIAAGSITVEEGEFVYVNLPKPMTENVTLTMVKTTAIGVDTSRHVIGVRRNNAMLIKQVAEVVVGA